MSNRRHRAWEWSDHTRFLPMGFFMSVLSPTATEPNALISLAYVGGVLLAVGLVILGIGLVKKPQTRVQG